MAAQQTALIYASKMQTCKVLCCLATAFCYHVTLYYTQTHLSYPSSETEICAHYGKNKTKNGTQPNFISNVHLRKKKNHHEV